jgi:hypothetical protein
LRITLWARIGAIGNAVEPGGQQRGAPQVRIDILVWDPALDAP